MITQKAYDHLLIDRCELAREVNRLEDELEKTQVDLICLSDENAELRETVRILKAQVDAQRLKEGAA